MLHQIAVPVIRPFFQNGHEAVENGLVDGLYPLNECKKVFFVAKQFSYPLPFPHQPHDAVPPAGGQQPVEEHHRRGEASDAVARAGTTGVHGAADGLPDHRGVGNA